MNTKRSKIMTFNKEIVAQDQHVFNHNNQIIEEVFIFEYLGPSFANDGKLNLEITNKTRKMNNTKISKRKSMEIRKSITKPS